MLSSMCPRQEGGSHMQHVFIIGSKGIPAAYGGYETFVDKLTECHQENKQIRYHVACKNAEEEEFEYHNARCFNVKVPDIGPAQAIYYDVAALVACCRYIQKHHIGHPIVYILACRIGYFAPYFRRKIHRLGGKIYVNPDGHEWMRAKWSAPVRKYWKLSEKVMTKYSDLLICDSKNIERYIHESYDGKGIGGSNPKTTYIAYGADTGKSLLDDDDVSFMNWLKEKGLKKKEYYLAVGRFVPENNYETMIREFMRSKSKRNHINKKIAITCVVAICYAILTYIYRKRKGIANNTDNTYIKALKIMLFSFGLTLIYMVLLYVRIGQHKLQRSENIFVIYAWGALQLLFHLDIF